jgi:hypothetical protein
MLPGRHPRPLRTVTAVSEYMSFSPTITHDSHILPGVRFTVHRIGLARRAEIDRKTLSLRQQLRELEMDYPPQTPKEEELAEQVEIAKRKAAAVSEEEMQRVLRADLIPLAKQLAAAAPLEAQKKRISLNEEYATIQSLIRVEWVRAGLISISDSRDVPMEESLDGIPVQEFLESGNLQLAAEIYEALTGDGRLAGATAKNSLSPGTSGVPDSQAMSSTIAAGAGSMGSMPSETVSATSPAR